MFICRLFIRWLVCSTGATALIFDFSVEQTTPKRDRLVVRKAGRKSEREHREGRKQEGEKQL